MRVTNKMMLNTVTSNLFRSQDRYLDIQTQASSGRRINRPSDDPIGITKDLSYRTTLASITQFNKNIQQAKSWLGVSDQNLGNISDMVSSAKELVVQMANDTYDSSARMSSATEMEEIFRQMIDAANAQVEGNYIFSGSKTDIPPILVNSIGAMYQGDTTNITLESEPSSYLKINALGRDFLTSGVRTLGDGTNLHSGLQPNLWLSYLHGGDGVDLGAGIFRIRTINGEFSVDVSAAQNVQDVLNAIDTAGIPNLTAGISDSGASFTLTDTSANHITVDTPLGLLNMGQGVDLTPGLVRFTTGAGTTVDVDISAATNVGGVVNAINTQLAAGGINGVTASIDPVSNSLVITDSNVISLDINISEASDGTHTAANLGLIGDVRGSLVGEDVKPYHIQVVENAAGQNTAKELGLLEGTEFNFIDGQDLAPNIDYFTLLTSLNNGHGFPLGKIRIINGLNFQDVDLAPLANDPSATVMDVIRLINSAGINVEAAINDKHTGITIRSTIEGRSLQVIEADQGRTAKDLGIFGSPDLLGNMLIAKRALERNSPEELNLALETFDGALNRVLVERSDVGARVNRAEVSQTRLTSFELQVTSQLSNVEDADITKVITDMTAAESVYQSALASAARMLQPSLIDFLK
jgi:flagellar hook-associated protein 3